MPLLTKSRGRWVFPTKRSAVLSGCLTRALTGGVCVRSTPRLRAASGPPKVKPPDFERIEKDIAGWSHGRDRRRARVSYARATPRTYLTRPAEDGRGRRGTILTASIVRICAASTGTCRTLPGPWTPANTSSEMHPAKRYT